MIELRPVDIFAGVEPKPKILLPNHWIAFSSGWPTDLDFVRGKTARIALQQQVPYEISYILKEGVYKDIDLSNETATSENLYPEANDHLYEILIGLKDGNYFAHVYFPIDFAIYRLDDPDMYPQVSSTTYKYLGAIKPSDSPADNPTFKIYAVNDLKPVYLRLVVDEGIDYEKCTLKLLINRCKMSFEVPPPHIMPKPIPYLDEIKWMTLGQGGGV